MAQIQDRRSAGATEKVAAIAMASSSIAIIRGYASEDSDYRPMAQSAFRRLGRLFLFFSLSRGDHRHDYGGNT